MRNDPKYVARNQAFSLSSLSQQDLTLLNLRLDQINEGTLIQVTQNTYQFSYIKSLKLVSDSSTLELTVNEALRKDIEAIETKTLTPEPRP